MGELGGIPLSGFLTVSAILFTMGALGFARSYNVLSGQLFVFFVMTVSAAEVAVGLALIVAIFRSKHSIDVDQMSSLKG